MSLKVGYCAIGNQTAVFDSESSRFWNGGSAHARSTVRLTRLPRHTSRLYLLSGTAFMPSASPSRDIEEKDLGRRISGRQNSAVMARSGSCRRVTQRLEARLET